MKILTNDNFEHEIGEHAGIAVVDFYADWCGPCKVMAPVLEEVSKKMHEIKFAKVNIDDQQEIAEEYDVMSIPTFIIFKDGKEAGRFLGARGKSDFIDEIKKYK